MEDKTCFLGFPEIQEKLKGSQEDHDLLVVLNTTMENMQKEVRHYMDTKANKEITNEKFIQIKNDFLEWKKDIQDTITSITNPISEEIRNIKEIQKNDKLDIGKLQLSKAKAVGGYLAASTLGGIIVTIASLFLNIIK